MDKVKKYLCCVDLTLGATIIGLTGVLISLCLVTILIRDSVYDDYTVSRNIALAAGLDWQHFHKNANASYTADPDGKLIKAIMTCYSTIYLLTNMTLVYATIATSRWCTIPWLTYQLFSCISKSVAIIYHATDDGNHFSNIFAIGSICYIVIIIWCWIIVFVAQTTWKVKNQFALHFTLSPKSSCSLSSNLSDAEHQMTSIRPAMIRADSVLDSPQPYEPNKQYSEI